jgi:hypothetical protein
MYNNRQYDSGFLFGFFVAELPGRIATKAQEISAGVTLKLLSNDHHEPVLHSS